MKTKALRLQEIVAHLRSPEGCPWDREQTHETLRSCLLEECYEAIDAINRADDENLCEELGDLLLLVVLHAQLGAERGAFDFEQLEAEVCEKMIRRHPHVFGDRTVADSGAVLRQWEQIKKTEKGKRGGIMERITAGLPALLRAQTVQTKASRVGFDWPDDPNATGSLGKIDEEILEIKEAIASGDRSAMEEEVGDLLFSVVNLSRQLGMDAETVLASATNKFLGRFREMEEAVEANGQRMGEVSLEALDAIWNQQKAQRKEDSSKGMKKNS